MVRDEEILSNVFKWATAWDAIILLDEADVHLSSRNSAATGIFLRKIEYFRGIMILATNYPNGLDVAIVSRIRMAFKYGEVGRDSRTGIWKDLLQKCQIKHSRGELDELANYDLSGRDVSFVCHPNDDGQRS